MDIETIFKRLGYPRHAGRIYETLTLSEVPRSVTDIAKEASVSRVVVYRCLAPMVQQKLVEEVVFGKRTYFAAGSAHRLSEAMQLLDNKVTKSVVQKANVRERDVPRSVRFFYGSDGIRAAFDDAIEHTPKGDTFFRYTSEQDLAKVNQYLARDYRTRRDKKKLERQVISNPTSGKQKRSRLERFVKFIPPEADQFEQNIIELVYGDRVSIIDLTKEEVMIIENKQLADFQKVIFKLLYKRL